MPMVMCDWFSRPHDSDADDVLWHGGKPCRNPREMDALHYVSRDQIFDIVEEALLEGMSIDGPDRGVLWLRIDRDILGLEREGS